VGQRPRKCHLLAGDTSFIRDLFGRDGVCWRRAIALSGLLRPAHPPRLMRRKILRKIFWLCKIHHTGA
jgi:hypothetical protein